MSYQHTNEAWTPRDCEHGQLARSCQTCYLDRIASEAVGHKATPEEAIEELLAKVARFERQSAQLEQQRGFDQERVNQLLTTIDGLLAKEKP